MSSELENLKNLFSSSSSTSSSNNDWYNFWEMPDGSQAQVRFLRDKNKSNPFIFLIEKKMHNIPLGKDIKKVPCLQMFGEKCPVCDISQEYYKSGDEDLGKVYWRKVVHLSRAVIVTDPLAETDEESVVGEVKTLSLSWQIFSSIKESFESGELDVEPYDYDDGTNFIIKKTPNGKYSVYTHSKFARKSSSIFDYIEEEPDLIDLSTLLPAKVDAEEIEVYLEASLTGLTLDEAEQNVKALKSDEPEDEEEEDDTPPPRKPKRKAKVVEEEEDDTPPPRKAKVVEEEEDDDTPPPRKPKRKAKVVEEVEEDDDEEVSDILAAIQRRNKD